MFGDRAVSRIINVLLALPAVALVGFLVWYFGFKSSADRIYRYSPAISNGFRATRLDGTTFVLSSDASKIVVVNFWAPWCEPCTREFPSLLKVADQMKEQIVILTIAEETNSHEIKKFLKAFDSHRSNLEFLIDPTGEMSRGFGTNQFPESYIYDRKLVLRRKVEGMADWSSPEVFQYLQTL